MYLGIVTLHSSRLHHLHVHVEDATIVDEGKKSGLQQQDTFYLNLKLMLTVQTAANECYRERAIKSSLNFKMKLWARLHVTNQNYLSFHLQTYAVCIVHNFVFLTRAHS